MIKIDKEFKNLIPPLSAEEYAQLEQNLISEGCRDAIVLWDNIIIDGHNRYEICTKHDIGFETIEMCFSDRSEVIEWIIRNQFGRRNLLPYVRTKLALKLEQTIASRAKKNQVRKPADSVLQISAKQKPIDTRKEVAKIASVSHDTVAKVKAIEAKATPEIKQKLTGGEMSINEAYKQIKKQEKKQAREQKAKDHEQKEKAISVEPAKDVKVKPGEWWQLGKHKLFCGDTSTPEFYKNLEHAALCFADPPYGVGKEGYDDSQFYWKHDYLMHHAKIVVVTPGISNIFGFAKRTKMTYLWSLACWLNNGMTRGAVGFGNWIYAAVFSRESIYRNAQDFHQISISTADNDDTKHSSRKPAKYMLWVVELFTSEGDLVIDPFAGSGQTLLTCEVSNRRCITGEIDPNFCSEIVSRWQQLTNEKAVKL